MLTTIATFSKPYEAHIARSRLEAQGIPAFVADEHTITMNWLYSQAMGGVRLQVPSCYRELAVTTLAEDKLSDLMDSQPIDVQPCPHCGSKDTEFYPPGKLPAYLIWLIVGFPLFPIHDGIKCMACNKTAKEASS